MRGSQDGSDEGVSELPNVSAAPSVGTRARSLSQPRDWADDGDTSDWGSTRPEAPSARPSGVLSVASHGARDRSKVFSDCSVAVMPSATSQTSITAVDPPDSGVLARLRLHALKERFIGLLVRWPVVTLAVMQVALLVPLIVFSYEVVVDPDIEAFMYRGTNSSLYRSSYRHAWMFSRLAPRNQLRVDAFDLIEGVPSADLFGLPVNASATASGLTYAYFSVHLIYHLSGGNVLTERTLYAIQQFEDALRAKPLWQELCRAGIDPAQAPASGASCDPGESLVGFVWPEPRDHDPTPGSGGRARLRLSGRGSQWLPVGSVIGTLAAGGEPMDRLQRFLPQDFARPAGGGVAAADALQSHFLFALPLGDSSVPGAVYVNEASARRAFHELLDQEVHPALDGSELLEQQGVRVFAHGPEVQRFEVELAWRRDCCFVIGSVIVALVVLALRLKSIALAFFGLLLIMESLPLSFVIFRLIAGTVTVNLPDLVALFSVIGLGSDVAIFEVSDSWRRIIELQGARAEESVAQGPLPIEPVDSDRTTSYEEACHTRRMRGYLRCMWASLLPSFPVAAVCTAGSFFGCLASQLQSFREVGLFLGLCVGSAALLVAAMLPLALVAAETYRFRRSLALIRARGADETVPFNVGRLVPDDVVCPDESAGPKPGGGIKARVRRLLEELWQAWVSSISTLRWWLLGALAAFLLMCLIGTLVAAHTDSVLLDLFGADHNQVAGRDLRDRFGSSVAAVASSPASQDSSVCDIFSAQQDSEWESCRDSDLRCGAWASVGQCQRSPGFMQARCPRSCGRCSYCLMRHCGVWQPPAQTVSGSGVCNCYTAGSRSGSAAAQATVVGLPPEMWPSVESELSSVLQGVLSATGGGYQSSSAWKQPPLVQEHWRSGSFALQPTFEVATLGSTPSSANTSRVTCYCAGATVCKNSGTLLGSFNHSDPASLRRLKSEAHHSPGEERVVGEPASASSARAEPGRRLLELDLRHRSREVSVTWGILVQEPGFFELFPRTKVQDSWQLDGMFEPGDPWVQRSLMAMSSNLPAELRAAPQDGAGQTWLHSFEHWLLQRGEQFPSRDFHRHMDEFLSEQPIHQRNVLRDAGRVQAVRVVLTLNVPTSPPLHEISDLKLAWDRHVEANNRQAGLRARNAWHTSDLWVLVDTHDAIVASTWFSLLISTAVVAIGAAVYTRDAQLTLICSATLMSVTLAQAFFMSVLLQWSFGFVEALALIAFAGHGATVGLRLAAAYGRAPAGSCGAGDGFAYGMRPEDGPASVAAADRYRRTLHALEAVGWGILGSAGMMAGTGFFMLLCTLQLHVKFGVAIFSITALSLLHSLLILPVVLLIAGPTPHGFQPLAPCRRRLRACVERLTVPPIADVEPSPRHAEAPARELETAPGGRGSGHQRADSPLSRAGSPGRAAGSFEPAAEASGGHQAMTTGSCLYLNSNNRRSDPAKSRDQRQEHRDSNENFECVDL